jgi:hypothetical protein
LVHQLRRLVFVPRDLVLELLEFVFESLNYALLLSFFLLGVDNVLVEQISLPHLLVDFLAFLLNDFLFVFVLAGEVGQLVLASLLDSLLFTDLNQFFLLSVFVGSEDAFLLDQVGLQILDFGEDLDMFGLLFVHGVPLVVERVVVLLDFLLLLGLLVLALANVDVLVGDG